MKFVTSCQTWNTPQSLCMHMLTLHTAWGLFIAAQTFPLAWNITLSLAVYTTPTSENKTPNLVISRDIIEDICWGRVRGSGWCHAPSSSPDFFFLILFFVGCNGSHIASISVRHTIDVRVKVASRQEANLKDYSHVIMTDGLTW